MRLIAREKCYQSHENLQMTDLRPDKSVRIDHRTHREMMQEKLDTGKDAFVLVYEAWQHYKAAKDGGKPPIAEPDLSITVMDKLSPEDQGVLRQVADVLQQGGGSAGALKEILRGALGLYSLPIDEDRSKKRRK